MSYSLDLRKRVVEHARSAEGSPTVTARLFKVGRATVNRWLKRSQLAADKPGPTKPSKVNLDALKQAVEENPEAYIDELAEQLKVSYSAVRVNLKRLNISRKKKHAVQGKKRESAQHIPAGT